MVIPAAGAAIVVVIAGLAIAVCVLVAGQFAFAFIYWLLRQASNAARSLPLGLGAPIVGRIAVLIGATWNIAIAYQHVLDEQFYWIHHYFRLVLHYFFAPILMPLYSIVTSHTAALDWLRTVYFAQVQTAFDYLFNHVGILEVANVWLRTTYFPQVQKAFDYLFGIAASHLAWIRFFVDVYFPQVQTTFDAVRADAALTTVALRELQAFLPLLRTLAEFETQTAQGIAGTLGRVGELERGQADILRDLSKVLPLSVVAAMGIAAIMNLERVARDPCHCLTVGDFNDLPQRVASLEELGP
jgi:hypothetical protein